MYEHFNPIGLSSAWWQHILMLVVSGILGYIIGYRSRKSEIEGLEAEFNSVDAALDDCLRSKKVVPAAFAAPVAAAFTPDDLKVVEGIGPKIEELFNANGIYTFAQLAAANAEDLRAILVGAGTNFQIHDPTTWPQQSALARDGKWDELKTWQDELNKGRVE
jgi:predicted flap endonuclease-1-like 5' DNA nuclease